MPKGKKKLPGLYFKRTTSIIHIILPIYLIFQGNTLQIQAGEPPVSIKKDERITKSMIKEQTKTKKQNPLIEAMKYKDYLKSPYIDTYSQVAQYFGVSRARVC